MLFFGYRSITIGKSLVEVGGLISTQLQSPFQHTSIINLLLLYLSVNSAVTAFLSVLVGGINLQDSIVNLSCGIKLMGNLFIVERVNVFVA